jgi:hypothetical protein
MVRKREGLKVKGKGLARELKPKRNIILIFLKS